MIFYDYYKTPGVRELCHRVKERDPAAIYEMASFFTSLDIGPDAVIIPAPQHEGSAVYTKVMADIIMAATGCQVMDVLKCTPRKPLYEAKKEGSPVDTGLFISEDFEGLPSEKDTYFLDTVIGTGITYYSACKSFKRELKPLVFAVDTTRFMGHIEIDESWDDARTMKGELQPMEVIKVFQTGLAGGRTALMTDSEYTPYVIVSGYDPTQRPGQQWDSAYDYYEDFINFSKDVIRLKNENDLNIAVKLIKDFSFKQYGERPDIEDYESIDLAYTDGFDEKSGFIYEIKVSVDLNNYKLIQSFGDKDFVTEYKSLNEMIDKELKWLDFDKLTTPTDEQLREISFTAESSEYSIEVYDINGYSRTLNNENSYERAETWLNGFKAYEELDKHEYLAIRKIDYVNGDFKGSDIVWMDEKHNPYRSNNWEIIKTRQIEAEDGTKTDITLYRTKEPEEYIIICGDNTKFNPDNVLFPDAVFDQEDIAVAYLNSYGKENFVVEPEDFEEAYLTSPYERYNNDDGTVTVFELFSVERNIHDEDNIYKGCTLDIGILGIEEVEEPFMMTSYFSEKDALSKLAQLSSSIEFNPREEIYTVKEYYIEKNKYNTDGVGLFGQAGASEVIAFSKMPEQIKEYRPLNDFDDLSL
ncbi:MAG: hypothetical protein IJ619_09160 [Eubacterium sp.]|nr:hypothetical protein [Eubacterium sp.]